MFKQAGYITILSIVVALFSNALRSDSIPLIKQSLKPAESLEAIAISKPIIQAIDLDQAYQLFNEGITFIDARDTVDFNNGHIPGALSNPGYFELLENLDKIISKTDPIVTYCGDGECGMSEDLADGLIGEGYELIYVFLGGWDNWVAANYPVEK
jgi:rhodanese-related sulfurtransferase